MPRSEQDNEQIRASRRSEILAAATRVFTDKGLARAKVTDIAAAARLSNGLIYHYFPSKEAVFEAIAIEMMARAEAEVDTPRARAVDALVEPLIRRRGALDDASPDASRVVMQAVLHGEVMSESLRTLLAAHVQRVIDRICQHIARAQQQGDLDPKVAPDELAHVMLFLFRGMSIRIPHISVPLPRAETLFGVLRLTASGMRRAHRLLAAQATKEPS
jgi:AcrR family transcriptional regulator